MLEITKKLQESQVRHISKNYPEPIIRYIVMTMVPNVLNSLASPPKRFNKGQGKGGNTNYAEGVLFPVFRALRVPGTKFHPNGSQKPPDIKLGEHEVELKSVKKASDMFAFNDSIPKPWIHYCFYAREDKMAIAIPGDILLLSLDGDRFQTVHSCVNKARRAGMTKKEEGLAYFYPRPNLSIRSFLKDAPANGYYDYDRNTLWVPPHDQTTTTTEDQSS